MAFRSNSTVFKYDTAETLGQAVLTVAAVAALPQPSVLFVLRHPIPSPDSMEPCLMEETQDKS